MVPCSSDDGLESQAPHVFITAAGNKSAAASTCIEMDAMFEKMYRAIVSGDAGEVESLLRSGFSSNAIDDNWLTPLMVASSRKQVKIAELLLDWYADPNSRNRIGMTPLMFAAYSGSVELVELLLKRGADPGAKNTLGETAYICAMRAKHADVAEIILKHVMVSALRNNPTGLTTDRRAVQPSRSRSAA